MNSALTTSRPNLMNCLATQFAKWRTAQKLSHSKHKDETSAWGWCPLPASSSWTKLTTSMTTYPSHWSHQLFEDLQSDSITGKSSHLFNPWRLERYASCCHQSRPSHHQERHWLDCSLTSTSRPSTSRWVSISRQSSNSKSVYLSGQYMGQYSRRQTVEAPVLTSTVRHLLESSGWRHHWWSAGSAGKSVQYHQYTANTQLHIAMRAENSRWTLCPRCMLSANVRQWYLQNGLQLNPDKS